MVLANGPLSSNLIPFFHWTAVIEIKQLLSTEKLRCCVFFFSRATCSPRFPHESSLSFKLAVRTRAATIPSLNRRGHYGSRKCTWTVCAWKPKIPGSDRGWRTLFPTPCSALKHRIKDGIMVRTLSLMARTGTLSRRRPASTRLFLQQRRH